MLHRAGVVQGPLMLLHGGAGPQDPTPEGLRGATTELVTFARAAAALAGRAPLDLVVKALEGMENSPTFNAGYGAALQSDGAARLTAALMDGTRQSFSAVIGLGFTRHPCRVAYALQTRLSRVLASPGNELVARQLALPVETVVTPERVAKWRLQSEEDGGLCDTVGAVVIDAGGHIAAGTSTGGRGNEFPGRVSDSGTVAGNYATRVCGVSATGIGEEIIDDALAARLETRVRDGMSLADASQRCFDEAKELKRQYGWISVGRGGHWTIAHTTPAMTYVVMTLAGEVVASSMPKG